MSGKYGAVKGARKTEENKNLHYLPVYQCLICIFLYVLGFLIEEEIYDTHHYFFTDLSTLQITCEEVATIIKVQYWIPHIKYLFS